MNASTLVVAKDIELRKRSGIDLFHCGQLELALVDLDHAAIAAPADAVVHNYRARVLDALGRPGPALLAIERALKIDPTNASDLKNRGVLLRKLGRHAEALSSFDAALTQRPNDVELLIKRAHLLNELDRRADGLSCAEQAVALAPENLLALNVRGTIREALGRYEEALEDFEHMLRLRPDHIDAINNRGMVLARQAQFAESLDCYDRSLSIDSHQAQAFYNRSLVRLALGDWVQGFREFESRWNLSPLKGARPSTAAPLWLGKEDIAGRTLLIYHEQGYGDTLQCARYVPLVAARGAKVILVVPPALKHLLRSLQGNAHIVALGDAIPEHDFQTPLMSLPLAFDTRPDKIPGVVPYLWASAERSQLWQVRVGPSRRTRIGVVWSGRRYAPVNYPRDMELAALKPLFALNADFISLQLDMPDADRALLADLPQLDTQYARHLHDFADTAALIEALDLVISVDTAVAHLAGALGKPIWLMNRRASCWRWLQEGSESPWYPGMRVFRQPATGDWGSVVEAIASAAATFVEQFASTRNDAPEESPVRADRASLRRPVRSGGGAGNETIRLICATRVSREEFMARTPLGRSLPLYRNFPRGRRIELRLFPSNTKGLADLYNAAIEESKSAPAILVFIHDDLYLNDFYWADHLSDGLREFDIVGLAGNRRRVAGQSSWMYLNDQFLRDSDENLSGVIGHGEGFPNLTELSVYGEPRQEVKLLDGVMLAVSSESLIETGLRFDPRFAFDFYDLDFCRQAELRGLRMGTWAISAIHSSIGKLGAEPWRLAYRKYVEKYDE